MTTGIQSRKIEDGAGARKYCVARARATPANANSASKVTFSLRRSERGKIHAASAKMVAKPAWIHSDVRIDPPVLQLLRDRNTSPEHVTETIQTANNGKVNNGVAAARIHSSRIQRINVFPDATYTTRRGRKSRDAEQRPGGDRGRAAVEPGRERVAAEQARLCHDGTCERRVGKGRLHAGFR